MTTRTPTGHPGITKITYRNGEVRYRLIISVGQRSDKTEIQQCHTLPTLKQAKDKQAEIRDARKREALVKKDNITFDELCTRFLDSRQDVREVTLIGPTW